MDGGNAWTSLSSLRSGSRSDPITPPKVTRRDRPTLVRLVALLAFISLVVPSCTFFPRTADAEEYQPLEIDTADLPDNYESVMLSRESGNEIVAIEKDTAVLREVSELQTRSGDVVADDDSRGIAETVTEQVFSTIVDGALSSGMANKRLLDDLSWRYYHADSSKRDKYPILPVTSNAKGLDEFESWADWDNYLRVTYLFNYPYRLVGFDDNKSWTSTSPNAEIEYQKWYEWYEGSIGSGSNGNTYSVPTTYYGSGTSNSRKARIYDVGASTYVVGNAGSTDNADNLIGSPISVTVGDSARAYIDDKVANGYSVFCYVGHTGRVGDVWTTNTGGDVNFTFFPSGADVTYVVDGSSRPYIQVNADTTYITYHYGGSGVVLQSDLSIRSVGNFTAANRSATAGSTLISGAMFGGGWVAGGDAPSADPVWPVYPQPETPVQPVTPTTPTPSNPVYSDNDTTSTTVDLQPILDAIRTLNTNVMSGFTALETDLASYFSAMTQTLTGWLKNASDWLELIWQELREVNQWLEGIFYSMGNGGSASEPDITVDSGGWWDWLAGILSGLLGDLPAAVSELTGTMDALRNLFPFSIPWDMAALLALFVSEPVTPVFDVPLPYGWSGGSALVASIHVDLSQWDGVMSAVRSVELAIFALGLALRTRQLLSNVEVSQ